MQVTLGNYNEILVNNRSSRERGDDPQFVCDLCKDIVSGVEPHDIHGVEYHSCSICESAIEKCTDCVHLIENEHQQWECSHFNKVCGDVAEDCNL